MAAETNLEREFKFDVDADFDPPDLRDVAGRTERLPAQHLTTTYFDTADHRLWARGVTLRHRLESEGDATARDVGKWTLKLPLPPGASDGGPEGTARDELSWKGGRADIPAEALAVLAGVLRRGRLDPVVVLETERRRLLLHETPDGAAAEGDHPWAEIDDDLVTVASGGREGLRFRQLELELLGEGSPPELDTVLQELRRAGAATGGGSKFALAAGLDEPGAAAPHDGRSAGASSRATGGMAAVVRRVLSDDLGSLLDWDYRLRVPNADRDAAGLDVEAVHQARVATRRLRSDLQTLAPVLDPVWLKHVRGDLRWLGALLGRLRDEDVLVERVRSDASPEDADAVEEIVRLVRSDRHLGATELCEALASDRYLEMLERLQAASDAPPLVTATGEPAAGSDVKETLASVLTSRRRALQAGVDDLGPSPSDEDLHHVRILAKRLRYAAEAVAPYAGKEARRTGRAAQRLQSVLGDLNDASIASRTLRELASHPSVTPDVAFVAGRIAGRAEAKAGAVRARWRKAARRLASG